MSVASTYFFQWQGLEKYLLRSLLLFSFCFTGISLCYSQSYTLRDQAEIKYQAQLTLMEYESILNLISNTAISEQLLKDAIQSAYQDPATRIFYSSDVQVADDLAPSSLDVPVQAGKRIDEYIQEFNSMYVKSAMETVDFYDFQISNLKQANYPYILVKYTVHFKGRHKKDLAPYKPVDRLAELRVERRGDRWVTYIGSITPYNPALPVTATNGDISLDTAVADDGTFANKLRDLISAQNAQEHHQNSLAIAQSWKAFDENRFQEIKLMAERAERERDYAKARELYAQALLVKPEEAALEARLAKLSKTIQQQELLVNKFLAGDYVEAIKDYSSAIAEDPQNADFYYGRGRCYEKLNELQTAIRDFSTAIKLDDKYADALDSRAKLYARTGQPQKAMEDYNQIIGKLQNAAAYYPERAKLKIALGDLRGALADYDEAIRLNPKAAVPYIEKGAILYQQKQTEQAIASFRAAIERDSLLADAFYMRGLAYVDNQNISSAAVDFEKARKIGLNEEQMAALYKVAANYATLGDEAMKRSDYKEALGNYIKLVLLSPADESAWVKKGDAHFQLQDYDNALQSYTKAVELDNLSRAYYKRGLVNQQLNQPAAAKSDFEKFIPIGWQLISSAEAKAANAKTSEGLERVAEEVAEGWYVLGNAQYMAEQYADALASLDKALNINKAYAEALFTRGAVQLGLQNYKKAIKDIERSIKLGIEDRPAIYLALGDAYRDLGQVEYAISIYTYIIDSVDKESDLAYIRRADSYKRIKQYRLALQDINKAIALNANLSRDVAFITNKGLLELYESKFQEADHTFDQALSIEKNDAWALYGKASVLASQDKLEESLDLYRKAFQTGKIEWSAIKDDPIIKHVSKQKAFKDLVDASLRL